MPDPTRVAIVTGAASGIGRHWATVLVREGHKVTVADVNETGLREAFSEGPDLLVQTLDVRSAERWRGVVAETVARFGRVDLLFNIAGGGRPGFLLEVPEELVDTTIDVNLKGAIHGMRAVAPLMVRQGSGHIVNVASLAGLSPT
jgi:dihydroanticapsin dehydrogenase